jgi:hypothetical protein
MQSPKPTPPPWRRTPTFAHVATQIPPATRPQSNAIHKRQVCCAFLTTRPPLSVSERGSAVLHARKLPSHDCHGSARRSSSSPTTVVSEPAACRARACNGQLAAFVDAYVIVSQDSSMGSRTLKRAGQAIEARVACIRFRPASSVGPDSFSTPSRTKRCLRPTGKPGSPTQTPSRRPPIQSGAARRRNGRKKSFLDPALVRAVRCLQSRSPTRTGGR